MIGWMNRWMTEWIKVIDRKVLVRILSTHRSAAKLKLEFQSYKECNSSTIAITTTLTLKIRSTCICNYAHINVN